VKRFLSRLGYTKGGVRTERMNVPPNGSPVSRRVQVRTDVELRVLDLTPTGMEPDSPVFVLLHGLSSNALLWRGVANELARLGFRSVSVDQRGHGLSDKPEGPYDLETVTDDLFALLNSDGLEGISRPVIAGQSWGANVVVEFGARFPGLARGIVAVDGGFIDLQSVFPNWEDCAEQMAPPRLAGTPFAQLEKWMSASHSDWPAGAIDDMLGFVQRHSDGTASPWLSFENHLKVLRGLWEHRPPERYPHISDPVWFIAARNKGTSSGWAATKEMGVELAQQHLSRSRVTWFDGADHDLHAQHPKQVAELLVSGVKDGLFE
jgi:pimeloyl-ACP methyl ester carboxylesterase